MKQLYQDDPLLPKNYMENLVEERQKELIWQVGTCCCRECCANIKALALVKLPPLYAASIADVVEMRFMAMTTQMQADITIAILHAIERVRKHPPH
jgi:competence protein ComFB